MINPDPLPPNADEKLKDFSWVLEEALNTSLHNKFNISLQLCIKNYS